MRHTWKLGKPPESRRRVLAFARLINSTEFAEAVVELIDGKWRVAAMPGGSMSELVIDRWIDIPPLQSVRKRRRKLVRRASNRKRAMRSFR